MALAVPFVVRLLFSRLPPPVTYLLAIPLGIFGAYLWERTVYLFFINPFYGTFSIPVFFVWLAGGVSSMIAIAGLGSRRQRAVLWLEVVLVGAVALGIGVGSDDIVNWAFEARQIQIVWVRWHRGTQPLELDRRLPKHLTAEEVQRLRRLGLTGHLEWRATVREGQGPPSRVVIVAHRMIEGEVELRLPAEESVIYIQQEDGTWQMEPPDAPLLRRTITLGPIPVFPTTISAFIKVPGGTVIASGVTFEDHDR